MKKNDKIRAKLVDILLKKAEGFYVREENFEYQKEKPQKSAPQYENLSFFGPDVRGDGCCDCQSDRLDLKQAKERGCDEKLALVKKKVASRYIPPDMLAVKILLEMFGAKEVDGFEAMTDAQLLALKKKVLEEIKDEY